MTSATRQLLGVVFRDLSLYLPALMRAGGAHLAIRNRAERLEPAPDGSGYRCDWKWTSELHAPKVIRSLGSRLMRHALAQHPILRTDAPSSTQARPATPQVSFLIGHRGAARLPHLLKTLETIAAQRGAAVECVVVEQDQHSQLAPYLPPWVRLVHTPPPTAEMPYCRSWSFNVAVKHARGNVLVLHDNDMLVPADYAAEILRRIEQGYEVVNLKRFIFYLSAAHTKGVFEKSIGLLDSPPETIVQNLEAGGSVAITRESYEQIGGMDESFVGWGGEDNEFWERAQTRRVWPWGSLPLVHLFHPAQPGKHDAAYDTAVRYRAMAPIDPRVRIATLRSRPSGRVAGPTGWPPAASSSP